MQILTGAFDENSLDDDLVLSGDDSYDHESDDDDEDLLSVDYEETWCPNCDANRAHTVMKQKQQRILVCSECSNEQVKHASTSKKAPKRREPKGPYNLKKLKSDNAYALSTWRKVIKEKADVQPLPYSIRDSFAVHDIVDHKKFGVGVICQKIEMTKVDVLFEQGLKRLVCAKT